MEKIKITIADSHFLSRKGLAMILNDTSDFTLLAEALSSSDLINQAKLFTPDIIIIDYTSPNFNIEGLYQIVKKYPKDKLLSITDMQSN